MIIADFDHLMQEFFEVERFNLIDKGLNGLQIGNYNNQLNHIAFALDASMEAINLAALQGAKMLFVHHGLFWGKALALSSPYYERVEMLVKNNIALYAMHLPLDAHSGVGNNITLAHRAGLNNIKPLLDIGFAGTLNNETDAYQLAEQVYGNEGCTIWPFKDGIKNVAIISGGATSMVGKVAELGYDCLVTGEHNHQVYSFCAEYPLAVIAGGHYNSEMYGLIAFKNYIEKQFTRLKTSLIELPTGC
jgi:dinuclear metal center YbgI/SA1388 family protein